MNVLYAEDHPEVRQIVAAHLSGARPGWELRTVDSAAALRVSLDDMRWDVALLDAHLGDGDALEVLAAAGPRAPAAVVLSADDDPARMSESVRRGVQWVTKDSRQVARLPELLEAAAAPQPANHGPSGPRPPKHQLVALEAAARLGSTDLAAEELGRDPSGVRRAVRQVRAALGCPAGEPLGGAMMRAEAAGWWPL